MGLDIVSALRRIPHDVEKAGARTTPRLSRNCPEPYPLAHFGICFERKQIPRIVENLRNALNAKEARGSDRIRPRQVRYQAALRPDFNSLGF